MRRGRRRFDVPCSAARGLPGLREPGWPGRVSGGKFPPGERLPGDSAVPEPPPPPERIRGEMVALEPPVPPQEDPPRERLVGRMAEPEPWGTGGESNGK